MNDTTPLPDVTLPPDTRCEYRRLPVEQLAPPEDLFDRRDVRETDQSLLPYPLTVYPAGEGFVIIDGCKRCSLALEKGITKLDCLVLSPPPDPDRAALLRMELNRFRPLRFFEKIRFISWLKGHCDERQFRATCAILSMDNRECGEIAHLVECDSGIVDAVYEGILDRSLAPELQRLEEPDRTATLTLFRSHRFSRQMQRELLDWLPELAFRERGTIGDILADDTVVSIGQSSTLNGPQKIERLREILYNRRFPTLARAKRTWKELATRCNPDPRSVQFKPSEAFEKNRLELRITITEAQQARTIFSRLSELEPDDWNRLIYPAQFSR